MTNKTMRRSLWVALLMLVPLAGCATAKAVRDDARAVLVAARHPGSIGRGGLEVCSKPVVAEVADDQALESLTFRLGERGGGCRATIEMTLSNALERLSKLFKKVNNLTVGDIVSLRSVKGLEQGVNLLQKLTVKKPVKRPKEPRFVFEEVNVIPSPPPRLALAPSPATQLGAVRGSIVDEEGRPLEAVWVSVNGEAVLTGPTGKYLLTIKPGSYEIRIFAQGFDDLTLPGQVVSPGQMLVLNLVLNATQPDNG